MRYVAIALTLFVSSFFRQESLAMEMLAGLLAYAAVLLVWCIWIAFKDDPERLMKACFMGGLLGLLAALISRLS